MIRSGEEIREAVKAEVKGAGFDAVGIAPIRLPAEENDRLGRWLERGMHGTMDWMARDPGGRTEPASLLTGAKSVVMVALNYHDPDWSPMQGGGRISRYAGGRDYHKVIRKMWKGLFPRLEALLPGLQGRWFVDSAPILEKAYAERAGIGWRGKHSNVIIEQKGSWFFLGGLLIDRELPPDRPAVDRCGSCTLCIEACPTGAIPAPYIVDSRLCISYLTIEHRGKVDDPLHAPSGDWLFGCDICQEVCPWNRFSLPSKMESFIPRPEVRRLTLDVLAELDEHRFDRLFRGTPVRRARWERFSRSVARAKNNCKSPGKES